MSDPEAVTRGASPPSQVPLGQSGPTQTLVAGLTSLSDRYVILETVGQGAMGVVVRAFDSKLQREVALKLLHAPHVDDVCRARMVREAQAMAQLNHACVVSVYDVYSNKQSVAIAMEYIAGRSLDVWLHEEKPQWSEIVAVFSQAAQGLRAAHRAGIVHRDFKPSNVMVGVDGRICVTDFGVAKVPSKVEGVGGGSQPRPKVSSPLVDTLTLQDSEIGTPRYMAPEQHASHVIDERADQYSLCVALWEALHGRSPFVGDELVLQKLKGPPAWEAGHVPSRIARAVLRGLQPAPEDRWPSMSELLRRLQSPRQAWMTGGAIAGLLAIGLAGGAAVWGGRIGQCDAQGRNVDAIWTPAAREAVGASIASSERGYAKDESTRVQKQLDRYVERWKVESRAVCLASQERGDSGESLRSTVCLQRASDDLGAAVGVLSGTSDFDTVRVASLVRSLRAPQDCTDIAAMEAGFVLPMTPGAMSEVAIGWHMLSTARAQLRSGQFEQALKTVTDPTFDPLTRHPAFAVERDLVRGEVLEKRGDFPGAEASLNRSMMAALALDLPLDAAAAASALAQLLAGPLGRPSEGVRVASIGLAFTEAKNAGGLSEVHSRAALANALRHASEPGQAREHLEVCLETLTSMGRVDPLEVAGVHVSLGFVFEDLGMLPDAARHHQESLELVLSNYSARHPNVGLTRNNLAQILRKQGRLQDAQVEQAAANAIFESSLGPTHPVTLTGNDRIAAILLEDEQYERAYAVLRTTLPALERAVGPSHPQVAATSTNLGLALDGLHRYAEAEPFHRRAAELWVKNFDTEHRGLAAIWDNLAETLRNRDRLEEAATLHERAFSLRERTVGKTHPDLVFSLIPWARLLRRQGHDVEAIRKLELARSLLAESGAHPQQAAEVGRLLSTNLKP
ncbi:MAG: serine/threonine-protein kinase [Nannocystaceae bacterium]|nr:serine/threonine-protein kinase [Nannocystaceae bacterium]